ncbi:MAG: addiction module toxin, HicA family [Clostridia bacterium]|nr:MAG: addiction module toxin, HicA family [Clostridia bacterium]
MLSFRARLWKRQRNVWWRRLSSTWKPSGRRNCFSPEMPYTRALRSAKAKYPELKYRRVLRLLQDFGVEIVRMKGSKHACISHDGHKFTFDLHPSQSAWPALVRALVKRAGISEEEFQEWLRQKT